MVREGNGKVESVGSVAASASNGGIAAGWEGDRSAGEAMPLLGTFNTEEGEVKEPTTWEWPLSPLLCTKQLVEHEKKEGRKNSFVSQLRSPGLSGERAPLCHMIFTTLHLVTPTCCPYHKNIGT